MAIRESLGITGGGILGLVSPLTFLMLAPEAWFVFIMYIIMLTYAVYEITLTVNSWRYERIGEYAELWT
jgi:ABC-type transport system involved in Fe-S cluster assembly fused permease/ATPase subunit